MRVLLGARQRHVGDRHIDESSRSTPASGGMSIRTGRGRPVRICLNASDTARGISRA